MYVVPPYFVELSGPVTVATGDPMWAFQQFKQSTYPGVWPHLDKEQILHDIAFRLSHASKLMGGQNCLSGGAAILFNLLRHNPFRYVRLCHSLYETGGFQTLRHRIQASEQLRKTSMEQCWSSMPSQPSYRQAWLSEEIELSLPISPVDWMVLMTLYDTQLSSFPPPPFMPFMPAVIAQHPKMTKPWQLKGWLMDLFGYRHATYHHVHLQPSWWLLKRAKSAIAKGGVAIALVNAERLIRGLSFDVTGDKTWDTLPKRPLAFSSHWHKLQPATDEPFPLNYPDSWVTLTDITHIPSWHASVHSTHRFAFTLHLGQELIPVHVNRAAFQQNCWGIMLAKS